MIEDNIIVQTIKEDSNETLSNSIMPSIQEIERFILFLNNKFKLDIRKDLIINIQDTSPLTKGFFMPKEHKNHYDNTTQALKYICISSLHLKNSPYETIAHELAHYINDTEGHTAKNNYHHKEFKKIAEKLLLEVVKGQYGYNITNETNEFKQMLQEFKPSPIAFHIFQNSNKKKAKPSRNLKYICSCNCIIRSAKNEDKPLNAICLYCNKPFIEVKTEGEGETEGENEGENND